MAATHSVNLALRTPQSPLETITRWIEINGYSQKEAARMLQWKEPELSMVLGSKRMVSERMAHDLARVMADMPGFEGWTWEDWMKMQRDYLVWARSTEGAAEIWKAKAPRTGILCDADILEALESRALRIEPFNKKFIQPASMDLIAQRVTWFGPRQQDGERLAFVVSEDRPAILKPGSTVRVVAREYFHMPDNLVARLAPVGSLVEYGVLYSFGIQLEPGWKGHPFFVLSHQGDEEIEITAQEGCVSVEFQFLPRVPLAPYGVASRPKAVGMKEAPQLAEGHGGVGSRPNAMGMKVN